MTNSLYKNVRESHDTIQKAHFTETRVAWEGELHECCEHDYNADVCKKAVNHEFLFASGNSIEFYGWTARTTDIGASV